ncbi:MAG: methyltransferase domain-containing protein [Acidimicrobiia bacterium]
MTGIIEFNEEAARRVEAVYATSDVVAQREEVLRLLDLRPGERVVDVGSGPGYLLASMATAVGPDGEVRGIDPSPAMLAMARSRVASTGWVAVEPGDACALPIPDDHFDAAVSTQVYEYVADIGGALSELARVLRPGGRALILDTDWDSVVCATSDPGRHARVMAVWDQHLVDPCLPRTLGALLRSAGFELTDRRIIPLFNPDYGPDTYSFHIISFISDFVGGRGGVSVAEARDWAADLRSRGEAGDYFFSINRYCFLATKR